MSLDWRSALSAGQQHAVLELIGSATQFDGVSPVGDQVLRELGHGRTEHLLATVDDEVVGYLNLTTEMAELVVDPGHRRPDRRADPDRKSVV